MSRQKIPTENKIAQKFQIDHQTGCWQWTGYTWKGYGKIGIGGKLHRVHRFVWENYVSLIPNGMQIDHLCRNRKCINPDHMRMVTSKENTLCGEGLAAINHRKTHCQHSHPFDDENTYHRQRGSRECKICRAEASARWRRKKRRSRKCLWKF